MIQRGRGSRFHRKWGVVRKVQVKGFKWLARMCQVERSSKGEWFSVGDQEGSGQTEGQGRGRT